MSEDPNALPGEPESAKPHEEQAPAQPAPSELPQYPPLPSFYEQQAAPQEDPYGAPITTPPPAYGAPPAGYGMPPHMPPPGYGAPPVYGVPPYMPPPGYVMMPYPPSPFGYEPLPPPEPPLPLGQAIRELPGQYKRILRKPSARTFAIEQSKAEWGIIWMQLLFLAGLQLLSTLTSFLISSSRSTAVSQTAGTGLPPSFLSTLNTVVPIVAVILTPALFFAGVGIQYLMAKMFKGTGQFKQQAYNALLYQVPMAVISTVISLPVILLSGSTNSMFMNFSSTASSAPAFSPLSLIGLLLFELAALGIFVYSIILNVYAIMGTHRLSGGKATGVVLIPWGIFIILYIILVVILVAVIVSAAASFR